MHIEVVIVHKNPWRKIYYMGLHVMHSFFLIKGPAADATDAPQPWRLIVQPYEEDDEVLFSVFPF
jgi:hypothetical protein